MKKKNNLMAYVIIWILILIYMINMICKKIFIPLLILSAIVLIVAIVMTYFKTEFIKHAWIFFVILLVLTIISYLCGYGFYKTEIGKILVDTGNTSYEAMITVKDEKKTAQEITKNTSKQIIDITINATDPNDPGIILIGEISKKAIDVS